MIRVVFLFLLTMQIGWAAPVIVKDLQPGWLKYNGREYLAIQSLNSERLNSIYFDLDAQHFKGQYLLVSSVESWDLFINGKLIFSGQACQFSLDSLANLYTPSLFFAVHSAVTIQQLKTQIVSGFPQHLASSDAALPRPSTFFRDFCIMASGCLMLFILILFRTNPQLTLDYFSFAKIFSVKERNENLMTTRIASSENLLFYLFCALLTGFLLSIVFYFSGSSFRVSNTHSISTLGEAFLTWVSLSAFILLLLTSKLIIVLLFSSLFNFRETISFQFFNFLRFVLFTGVVMALLSLIYFIARGEQGIFYQRLIILALALLSAGSVMVLIKLLARASFSFFHLFSYLCASEIIPLVIIIKIFF